MFVFLVVGSMEKEKGGIMSKRSDEIWTLKLYREFHGLNYGRHCYSDRNSQRPVKNHKNYGSVHFHGRGMPR